MQSSFALRACLVALLGLSLAACGSSNDNNHPDSGQPDSGHPDSGQPDSGQPDSGTPDSGTPDAGETFQLTILHTNDLHSYLEAAAPSNDYTPLTINDDTTIGGFSRLAAHVAAEKTTAAAANEPVLLLDSGDFMMGTLFQTLGLSDAAELMEMKHMGYDAITFGNHEFDFGTAGLAGILQAATTQGFDIPIVQSNMTFSSTDTGDDQLASFQTGGLIVPKLVKTLANGLKVGIFGYLGTDADKVAPLAKPVTFDHTTAHIQSVIDDLRNNDHVDLVIMVSHGSSYANNTGEDVDIANAVNGLDVIISGHSHQAIPSPLTDHGTLIVQTGAYGANLGEMKLTVTRGASPAAALDSYQLIPNDDTLAGDAATETRIQGYIADIDTNFSPFGLTYGGTVAETSFDLLKSPFAETGIGDLVTDSFRNMAAAQLGATVDIAVESGSNIRASIEKGTTGLISFADLFRVEPLGAGTDGIPGYPLVDYYLTGCDVKSGLELSAASQTLNADSYFLQVSGLSFTYDPARAPFDRVTAASVGGSALDYNFSNGTCGSTCYHVVTTEYVANLFPLVSSASHGALSITPHLSDCTTAVTDFSTREIHWTSGPANGQVLHQWEALTFFMTSGTFADTNSNGIKEIPSVYSAPQGRINTP